MKPFLAGRPTMEGVALRPSTGSLESSAPLSSGHSHGQSPGLVPSVECVKQGDKVVRLIVTCTCGERIEVECLYPAGG